MVVVCPKCDVALILLEFGGVEVDYCPRCDGIWLDSGEVEQLVVQSGGSPCHPLQEFMEQKSRGEAGRQTYLCPRCDRPMREVVRRAADGSELILDRCPRGDGIWFDKGELQMLIQSLPPEANAGGALTLLNEVLGCYTETTNTNPSEGDQTE